MAIEITAADHILRELQNNPDMWIQVVHILSNLQNLITKFFALQVLEGVIKYRWNALFVEQRDGKINYISDVIVKLSSDEISLRREMLYVNKLNIILVQHEWLARWQSFIPNLFSEAKTSETTCKNCMPILKVLFGDQLSNEEPFDADADSDNDDAGDVENSDAEEEQHSDAEEEDPSEEEDQVEAGEESGEEAGEGGGGGEDDEDQGDGGEENEDQGERGEENEDEEEQVEEQVVEQEEEQVVEQVEEQVVEQVVEQEEEEGFVVGPAAAAIPAHGYAYWTMEEIDLLINQVQASNAGQINWNAIQQQNVFIANHRTLGAIRTKWNNMVNRALGLTAPPGKIQGVELTEDILDRVRAANDVHFEHA